MSFYESFETSEFGSICIVWKTIDKNEKINRIFLSNPSKSSERIMNNKYKNLKKRSNKQNSKVIGLISRFLNGEEIKFDLNILDFQNCSKFQKRVLIVESMIPRGKVNTYKLLAQNIGSPNASRAVGNALAKNPFPIIIPCHRVIKSNFQIGNYQGGSVMKRKLLESEGVQFKENDMVDPKHLWA